MRLRFRSNNPQKYGASPYRFLRAAAAGHGDGGDGGDEGHRRSRWGRRRRRAAASAAAQARREQRHRAVSSGALARRPSLPGEMVAGANDGAAAAGDGGAAAGRGAAEGSSDAGALSQLTFVHRLSENFSMVGPDAPLEARAEYRRLLRLCRNRTAQLGVRQTDLDGEEDSAKFGFIAATDGVQTLALAVQATAARRGGAGAGAGGGARRRVRHAARVVRRPVRRAVRIISSAAVLSLVEGCAELRRHGAGQALRAGIHQTLAGSRAALLQPCDALPRPRRIERVDRLRGLDSHLLCLRRCGAPGGRGSVAGRGRCEKSA